MLLNGPRVKDITPRARGKNELDENSLLPVRKYFEQIFRRKFRPKFTFPKMSPGRNEVEAPCTFPGETALDVAHELPEQTRHLNVAYELPEQEEI